MVDAIELRPANDLQDDQAVPLASAADDLTVSGTWSNIALVADSDVDPGGSGISRTGTTAPATGLYEMTVITTSVSDGTATTEVGKEAA